MFEEFAVLMSPNSVFVAYRSLKLVPLMLVCLYYLLLMAIY